MQAGLSAPGGGVRLDYKYVEKGKVAGEGGGGGRVGGGGEEWAPVRGGMRVGVRVWRRAAALVEESLQEMVDARGFVGKGGGER